MQLKRSTDVLLRILVYLASHEEQGHISIHDLSEKLNWNINLLIKVSHLGVQQGWLKAVRGRAGGVALAKPAAEYRIGDIVRQMEGDEEFVDCDQPRCPLLDGGCRLRGLLRRARDNFYRDLNESTLADLAAAAGLPERAIAIKTRPCNENAVSQ